MAFGNATIGDLKKIAGGGGGGGGTKDYTQLTNKPSINGVELTGNKTSEQLNIGGGISFVDRFSDIATGIPLADINAGLLLVATDTSGRRISGIFTKADITNDTEYVFGYSNEYSNNKFVVADNVLTITKVSGRDLTHVYVF